MSRHELRTLHDVPSHRRGHYMRSVQSSHHRFRFRSYSGPRPNHSPGSGLVYAAPQHAWIFKRKRIIMASRVKTLCSKGSCVVSDLDIDKQADLHGVFMNGRTVRNLKVGRLKVSARSPNVPFFRCPAALRSECVRQFLCCERVQREIPRLM